MRLSIIDQIPGSLLPFIHTLSLTPGLAEMYRAAEPVTPSLVSLQEKPSGNSAETAAAAEELATKKSASSAERLLEVEPKRPIGFLFPL